MCKPKHEGGRRCAAHTRPAYLEALKIIAESPRIDDDTYIKTMEPIAYHASTPSGHNEVQQAIEQERTLGNEQAAGLLQSSLDMGDGMKRAHSRLEEAIRAE